MAVLNTISQLYKLMMESKGLVDEELVIIHRDVLCGPIKEYFPNNNLEEIQFELLNQGLFSPYEMSEYKEKVDQLKDRNLLQIVQEEFERLREMWSGVDLPIYLYPLTKYQPSTSFEVKKNGVTYSSCIFLFIDPELEVNELKALVAHEYHHACRLSILKKNSKEIALLDSLILEGMAEYAVESLYGESLLSPWTKSYSIEILKGQWKKNFLSNLDLPGVQNHFPYLYGSEVLGLPKWIGYCIGYQLIQSFMSKHKTYDLSKLLHVPSKIILEEINFN